MPKAAKAAPAAAAPPAAPAAPPAKRTTLSSRRREAWLMQFLYSIVQVFNYSRPKNYEKCVSLLQGVLLASPGARKVVGEGSDRAKFELHSRRLAQLLLYVYSAYPLLDVIDGDDGDALALAIWTPLYPTVLGAFRLAVLMVHMNYLIGSSVFMKWWEVYSHVLKVKQAQHMDDTCLHARVLQFLVVDPAVRRHGVASALVKRGTARCDDLGYVAYLDAGDDGQVNLCTKMDFGIIAAIEQCNLAIFSRLPVTVPDYVEPDKDD
ncbi:hypothetical protein M885DRAFT_504642 [Pelagophyceae sp. CCMP2097]|nr:hypothetical protein M885DRAFT_504642 [Pelagophyceae sp. CCMP2097]|mmetsp:Transcript_9402/g.31094  ORF Transcript_9402/g.31094 Transcript_9402/m.31094 type:complete len:264 (-) Transcript_9402:47-838(-)